MTVTTTFEFDKDEYYRAVRAAMRYNPYGWLIPVAGIVVPVVMIWFGVGRHWNEISLQAAFWSALPWILLGAFYLMLMPMMARSMARRAVDNNPALRGPQTRTLDANGLEVRGAGFTQTLAWSDIVKAVETTDLFLLFYNKRVAHYVPKRPLDSSRLEIARELIRTNLPDRFVVEGSAWSSQHNVRVDQDPRLSPPRKLP